MWKRDREVVKEVGRDKDGVTNKRGKSIYRNNVKDSTMKSYCWGLFSGKIALEDQAYLNQLGAVVFRKFAQRGVNSTCVGDYFQLQTDTHLVH